MRKTVRRSLIVALILFLLLGFGLWRASKASCWQLVGEVICRVATNEKIIALSFDDGPTPEGVDFVLPELEKRGIKATFFLIGDGMEKFPGQAERLLAAGHELGNHTYSHKQNIFKSYGYYQQQVMKADALLRKAGVAKPTLFRPPYGRRLIGLPWAVEEAGYRMVTWDVADDLARHKTPALYASDIVRRAKPGSIILIHPMYRGNTVERNAVPLVLDGLIGKGYRIVPVGELLKLENVK